MAAAVKGRDSEGTERRRGRELQSAQTKACFCSGRDGDSERTERPRIYRAAPARARLRPRPSASRANAPPAGGGEGLAGWGAPLGAGEAILPTGGRAESTAPPARSSSS